MLFDLRSRGRRRTVRVVYIVLAMLIVVGLLGVGFGGAGLFSLAGSGGGGSGAQSSAINSETKSAINQTKTHPNSAAAWASLVAARYSAANAVGLDTSTGTYTSTGQKQLTALTEAYARYVKLAPTPSQSTATYAAEVYSQLGQYTNALGAWQAAVGSDTSNLKGLECVAMSAAADKNARVADLAERQLYANKLPKATKTEVKGQIAAVKASPSQLTTYCGSAAGG